MYSILRIDLSPFGHTAALTWAAGVKHMVLSVCSCNNACLQAIPIQEWVYQFLGAGPVAFLYGQVADQQDAPLQERALYRLMQLSAQTSPFCPDGSLDLARPIVNPAQFLGVLFLEDEDTVRLPTFDIFCMQA